MHILIYIGSNMLYMYTYNLISNFLYYTIILPSTFSHGNILFSPTLIPNIIQARCQHFWPINRRTPGNRSKLY